MSKPCKDDACRFHEPECRSFKARITGNDRISEGYYILSFLAPEPPFNNPDPLPGQFYMIEPSARSGMDPLLKRPFCYFRHRGREIQLLYKVAGRGTKMMTALGPGDEVGALGPLGASYPIPRRMGRAVVVAGGVGIASVYPLLEALKGRATLIYGARTARTLILLDDLARISNELLVATDDGSMGHHGSVMGPLEGLSIGPDDILYACGPTRMMAPVIEYARACGVKKGHVSLEAYMACGVGACMGCVTPLEKGGYARVCKEGPVFDMYDIRLAGGARD